MCVAFLMRSEDVGQGDSSEKNGQSSSVIIRIKERESEGEGRKRRSGAEQLADLINSPSMEN